jgi:hypothetical protein
MRFGIGEKSDHTLEDAGQDSDLPRERILQIASEGPPQAAPPVAQQAPQGLCRELSRTRRRDERVASGRPVVVFGELLT